MNRISLDEFIREFSKRGYTLKDSKVIINDFEDTVYDIISKGNSLRLIGFLDFITDWKDERIVMNPRANKKVLSKPHYTLKIKPGYTLRTKIAEASEERRMMDAEE